jgi:hypothetical protein
MPTGTPTPEPSPTETPTPSPSPTETPAPTESPTPTPTPVAISGTIASCANPSQNPIANVTVEVTGDATFTTLSNVSGQYQLLVPPGGNYTVTLSKFPVVAGSTGINTVDLVATQRHYLGVVIIPPGCRLTAADANGDTAINTVDVVAIQRFYLGLSTGIANVGKYKFIPASRTYSGITADIAGEDYSALVVGDVSPVFVQ